MRRRSASTFHRNNHATVTTIIPSRRTPPQATWTTCWWLIAPNAGKPSSGTNSHQHWKSKKHDLATGSTLPPNELMPHSLLVLPAPSPIVNSTPHFPPPQFESDEEDIEVVDEVFENAGTFDSFPHQLNVQRLPTTSGQHYQRPKHTEQQEFIRARAFDKFHPFSGTAQYVTAKKLATPTIATLPEVKKWALRQSFPEPHGGLFDTPEEFYN